MFHHLQELRSAREKDPHPSRADLSITTYPYKNGGGGDIERSGWRWSLSIYKTSHWGQIILYYNFSSSFQWRNYGALDVHSLPFPFLLILIPLNDIETSLVNIYFNMWRLYKSVCRKFKIIFFPIFPNKKISKMGAAQICMIYISQSNSWNFSEELYY